VPIAELVVIVEMVLIYDRLKLAGAVDFECQNDVIVDQNVLNCITTVLIRERPVNRMVQFTVAFAC
jgi:hypothetical protein